MAYSTTTELVLGNIPVPADAQKYVDMAANEIDAALGMRYRTPIVTDQSVEQRPVQLLLNSISIYLSSGLLVLAKAAGSSDDQNHQYGLWLVNEARLKIQQILNGEIILPGIPPVTEEQIISTAPILVNADDTSYVDAFAGVFGNPAANVLNTVRPAPGYNRAWWQ